MSVDQLALSLDQHIASSRSLDSNKWKVTFNVNEKEHTVYFPKKVDKVYGLNSIANVKTIKIGEIDCPIYDHHKEYQFLMVGTIAINFEVT